MTVGKCLQYGWGALSSVALLFLHTELVLNEVFFPWLTHVMILNKIYAALLEVPHFCTPAVSVQPLETDGKKSS